MIDTVRGVLRVRKWPKKRGPPKSAKQRFWIDWFTQANLLAKYADPMSQVRAIEMTKGTGLYPRDVLLSAMRGRLYWWADETGWRWFPMAATQDVSNSLDTLSQVVGGVLVRALDRWRAPVPGAPNDVLTYQGAAAPPIWKAPGGGVAQGELAGTPIVPDNTVNNYIFDVTAEFNVQILLDRVGFAGSTTPFLRFSTDGGVTYRSGATDYTENFVYAASDGDLFRANLFTSNFNSATNHDTKIALENLRAGRCAYLTSGGRAGTGAIVRGGFARFDSPITHVKLYSSSGVNFNAGTIRAIGLHSA